MFHAPAKIWIATETHKNKKESAWVCRAWNVHPRQSREARKRDAGLGSEPLGIRWRVAGVELYWEVDNGGGMSFNATNEPFLSHHEF